MRTIRVYKTTKPVTLNGMTFDPSVWGEHGAFTWMMDQPGIHGVMGPSIYYHCGDDDSRGVGCGIGAVEGIICFRTARDFDRFRKKCEQITDLETRRTWGRRRLDWRYSTSI